MFLWSNSNRFPFFFEDSLFEMLRSWAFIIIRSQTLHDLLLFFLLNFVKFILPMLGSFHCTIISLDTVFKLLGFQELGKIFIFIHQFFASQIFLFSFFDDFCARTFESFMDKILFSCGFIETLENIHFFCRWFLNAFWMRMTMELGGAMPDVFGKHCIVQHLHVLMKGCFLLIDICDHQNLSFCSEILNEHFGELWFPIRNIHALAFRLFV